MTSSRFFIVDLATLSDAAAWVRERLGEAGLAAPRRADAELAFVEAFTNIARHGGPGRPGQIEVEVSQGRGDCAIVLRDAGAPFDPARTAAPERRGDEAHGMGMILIQRLSDDLRYERREEMNILSLVFRITGGTPPGS